MVVCLSVFLWQLLVLPGFGAPQQLPAGILLGFAVLRGWHCSVGAAEGPAVQAGGSACARAAPSFSVQLCKLKIPASLLVGQQCSPWEMPLQMETQTT